MMQSGRLKLRAFWIDHRDAISGVLLCGAFAVFLSVVVGFQLRQLQSTPPTYAPSEGVIIGFVGGDSRFSTGVLAYVRTHGSEYGFVRLPFASGCRNGDRIFLTQWRVGGRLRYMVRSPGCSRPLA
jgi:hypothetical protein